MTTSRWTAGGKTLATSANRGTTTPSAMGTNRSSSAAVATARPRTRRTTTSARARPSTPRARRSRSAPPACAPPASASGPDRWARAWAGLGRRGPGYHRRHPPGRAPPPACAHGLGGTARPPAVVVPAGVPVRHGEAVPVPVVAIPAVRSPGSQRDRPGPVPGGHAPERTEQQRAADVLRRPVVGVQRIGIGQAFEDRAGHDHARAPPDLPEQRGPGRVEVVVRGEEQIQISPLPQGEDDVGGAGGVAGLGEPGRQGDATGELDQLIPGVQHPRLPILLVVRRQSHVHEAVGADAAGAGQIGDAQRYHLDLARGRLDRDGVTDRRPLGRRRFSPGAARDQQPRAQKNRDEQQAAVVHDRMATASRRPTRSTAQSRVLPGSRGDLPAILRRKS